MPRKKASQGRPATALPGPSQPGLCGQPPPPAAVGWGAAWAPLPLWPLFVVTHLWFPGTLLFLAPMLLRLCPDSLQISN